MIQGFHHPGIVVPNLEAASQFYCEMLGFEFLHDIAWNAPNAIIDQIIGLAGSTARGQMLKGQNCYFELWEYSAPTPAGDPAKRGANDLGIRHLAFQVDDAQIEYERLKKLGGIVMNKPIQVPNGGTAVYCRDPFGNIIEFSTAAGRFPDLKDLGRIGEP